MSVHRTGRAEDNHRRAVAPRVEDRHGRMHKADVGVQCYRHRLLRYLAVAIETACSSWRQMIICGLLLPR